MVRQGEAQKSLRVDEKVRSPVFFLVGDGIGLNLDKTVQWKKLTEQENLDPMVCHLR